MRKVAYITATSPFGTGEVFILNEMLAMKDSGVDLLIVPRDYTSEMLHQCGKRLADNTIQIPRFNLNIALKYVKFTFERPHTALRIFSLAILKSRNIKIAIKNLIFLPKAVFLSDVMREKCVSHIHAHWGSTTSTIAYVVSKVTGIPWSFTLHRWDITENNLLKDKASSAEFVRCISDHGRNELIDIVGLLESSKIRVIPMGTYVEDDVKPKVLRNNIFTIVTPANLLPVKGHKYLLDACIILKERRQKFRCIFYGCGHLKAVLERYVEENGLQDYVNMPGAIPNEKLIEKYRTREVNVVVLPSINTENGEHEGIPVSLMEAMAFGIPVISTDTGGINELVGDGSGIIVEEKNGLAIANAVEKLINDNVFMETVGEKGRDKIKRHFNLRLITDELKGMIENS